MKTAVAFLGMWGLLGLGLAGAVHAQALTMDAVNGADLADKAENGVSPAILKAQVLLDRARFSPGAIDGRDGENVIDAASKPNVNANRRPNFITPSHVPLGADSVVPDKHLAWAFILSEWALKVATTELAEDAKYADIGCGKLPRQGRAKPFRVRLP